MIIRESSVIIIPFRNCDTHEVGDLERARVSFKFLTSRGITEDINQRPILLVRMVEDGQK